MTFAQTLQRLMDSRGLTAKELVEMTGINAPYFSRLLNGKIKDPTWEKACAIIDAFGISVDEFKQLQESEQKDCSKEVDDHAASQGSE